MNKKISVITSLSVILFGLALFFYFLSNKKEKPFNKIEFDGNNSIMNNTKNSFYDTILLAGLNQLEIKNIQIHVSELSENFRGLDLKAHIRENNGIYFIFINDYSKDESIDILSHELIHLKQYHTKELIYADDILIWRGDRFGREELPYESRPWEIHADFEGRNLSKDLEIILYPKN